MAEATTSPTRTRKIIAAVIVLATIIAVWIFIDYRTQPPPPPNPIGQIQPDDK